MHPSIQCTDDSNIWCKARTGRACKEKLYDWSRVLLTLPRASSILLEQIKQATQGIDSCGSVHLHPSLYPVLLLLSRLYPSALDGADSALNMAAFIPFVIRCVDSPVLKTRSVAARSLVPLVSGESLVQTLKDVIGTLPQQRLSCNSQNRLHGTLLQIQSLLQGHINEIGVPESICKKIAVQLLPELHQSLWLVTRHNPCSITKAVYLNIFEKFVVDLTWTSVDIDSPETTNLLDFRQAVFEAIWNDFSNGHQSNCLGEVFCKKHIAKILLSTDESFKSCSEDSTIVLDKDALLLGLLSSPDYEVRQVTLQFINNSGRYLSLLRRSENILITEKQGKGDEMVPVINKLVSMLGEEEHGACLRELMFLLCRLTTDKYFKLNICLKMLEQLRSLTSTVRSGLRESLVPFMGALVASMLDSPHNQVLMDRKKAVLETVRLFSECIAPCESADLRYQVAKSLGQGRLLSRIIGLGCIPEALDMCGIVVKLLQDDSADVKDCMAQSLTLLRSQMSSVPLKDNTSSSSSIPVQPTLALFQFLHWIKDLHQSVHPIELLRWMMGLMLSLSSDVDGGNDEHFDRLFEKSDLNAYAEDGMMIEILRDVIMEIANQVMLSQNEAVLSELKHMLAELFDQSCGWLALVLADLTGNYKECFAKLFQLFSIISVGQVFTKESHSSWFSEGSILQLTNTLNCLNSNAQLLRLLRDFSCHPLFSSVMKPVFELCHIQFLGSLEENVPGDFY